MPYGSGIVSGCRNDIHIPRSNNQVQNKISLDRNTAPANNMVREKSKLKNYGKSYKDNFEDSDSDELAGRSVS